MSPRVLGLSYVVLAMFFEALAQLSFKRGADNTAQNDTVRLLQEVWYQRMILLGIAFFLVEAVFWTMALQLLDVSLAVPAGSLCFVFIALLSRWWLHEQIAPERWIGIGLILVGVVLIGFS